MSRILVLAAVTALLGLTACNKPAEETVPPPAAAPAPEAAMPAESAPAAPPAMEKPTASAPAAKSAPETKPAAEAKPEAMAPAAAAPAAKSGVLTRDEAMALAAKGNCVACHKIETKLVGPAWQDVGAKYKGDPNAVATITSHIKSGGSFGWKFGVMPPRGGSQISDADVENLAKFIASLK